MLRLAQHKDAVRNRYEVIAEHYQIFKHHHSGTLAMYPKKSAIGLCPVSQKLGTIAK
jgi:hypothetical protein